MVSLKLVLSPPLLALVSIFRMLTSSFFSMIAQELSKLSDQQCLLQDAVTNLNLRVVDALNQP